jgi:Transaldolase/Fructose-6-phosphate aldolase
VCQRRLTLAWRTTQVCLCPVPHRAAGPTSPKIACTATVQLTSLRPHLLPVTRCHQTIQLCHGEKAPAVGDGSTMVVRALNCGCAFGAAGCTEALVKRGHSIARMYEDMGIPRSKFLLRIPATYEGIQAARILEADGLATHLILIYRCVWPAYVPWLPFIGVI